MVGDTCVPKLILQEFNSIKKLTPATRDGVGVALDKVSLINERAREIAFLDHWYWATKTYQDLYKKSIDTSPAHFMNLKVSIAFWKVWNGNSEYENDQNRAA